MQGAVIMFYLARDEHPDARNITSHNPWPQTPIEDVRLTSDLFVHMVSGNYLSYAEKEVF